LKCTTKNQLKVKNNQLEIAHRTTNSKKKFIDT